MRRLRNRAYDSVGMAYDSHEARIRDVSSDPWFKESSQVDKPGGRSATLSALPLPINSKASLAFSSGISCEMRGLIKTLPEVIRRKARSTDEGV